MLPIHSVRVGNCSWVVGARWEAIWSAVPTGGRSGRAGAEERSRDFDSLAVPQLWILRLAYDLLRLFLFLLVDAVHLPFPELLAISCYLIHPDVLLELLLSLVAHGHLSICW
jgi:hypothetical protein